MKFCTYVGTIVLFLVTWTSTCILGKHVVIVGAGTAGIAAARYLLDHSDYQVTVLEANPSRYGGRIWTYSVPIAGYGSVPVELGAMWIHSSDDPQQPIVAYAAANSIPLKIHSFGHSGAVNMFMGDATNVLLPGEEAESARLFSEGLKTWQELSANFLNNVSREDVSIPDAIKLDTLLSTWYNNIPDFERHSWSLWIEAYAGAEETMVSARLFNGLQTNSDIGWKIGQDKIVSLGYQSILDHLVNNGQTVNIQLGKTVTAILVKANRTVVQTQEENDIESDYVIVTVPLGVLKNGSIVFEPELSHAKRDAIRNIGFGNYVKYLAVFDTLFWPESVDRFIFFPNASDDQNWRTSIINLQLLSGLPALLGSFCGRYGSLAQELTDEELQAKIFDIFQVIFPKFSQKAHKIRHFARTNWQSDPLFHGSLSYGKLGMHVEDAHNVRTAHVDRVFFAGEHTAFPESMHATVHGAFISGQRVAHELLAKDGVKLGPPTSKASIPFYCLLTLSAALAYVAVLTIAKIA